jgi:hypothetical protein
MALILANESRVLRTYTAADIQKVQLLPCCDYSHMLDRSTYALSMDPSAQDLLFIVLHTKSRGLIALSRAEAVQKGSFICRSEARDVHRSSNKSLQRLSTRSSSNVECHPA